MNWPWSPDNTCRFGRACVHYAARCLRAGVAPDHPKIKSISAKFETTAEDTRFRFFGNIEVGRHAGRIVTIQDGRILADELVAEPRAAEAELAVLGGEPQKEAVAAEEVEALA